MTIAPLQGNQQVSQQAATSQQAVQSFVAEAKENLAETKSFMQDMIKGEQLMDSEVSLLTSKQLGVEDKSGSQNAQVAKEAKEGVRNELLAEMAAVMTEEEVERKKKSERKKSKFEEKMDKLGKLEGQIDVEQLDQQEKGIVQEFFDNMARIKHLRHRLKQLNQEESNLKSMFKQGESDKERQKRRHKEILEEIKDKNSIKKKK
ncbi:hypothetical protein HOG98_07245 [bacterium]|jgi:hypothetical protein|nr:hypothetical protein [bacterium]